MISNTEKIIIAPIHYDENYWSWRIVSTIKYSPSDEAIIKKTIEDKLSKEMLPLYKAFVGFGLPDYDSFDLLYYRCFDNLLDFDKGIQVFGYCLFYINLDDGKYSLHIQDMGGDLREIKLKDLSFEEVVRICEPYIRYISKLIKSYFEL